MYMNSRFPTGTGANAVQGVLRTSLICPIHEWVPCPQCDEAEWSTNPARFARSMTNSTLSFAKKNMCGNVGWFLGINHLVVALFLLMCILALSRWQRKQELKYDESMLTASDFTIQVDNPPLDATEPDGKQMHRLF